MKSKSMTATTAPRGLYGVFAGGLLTGIAGLGAAAILAPTAGAAPAEPTQPAQPGGSEQCSASAVATANSSVSASLSSYLQQHPQANEALTDIAKQPPTQAQASYQTYFTANPDVAKDLKVIQQPVSDLSTQCNQVSPSLLTDALKSA
jgi:heme-binding protein